MNLYCLSLLNNAHCLIVFWSFPAYKYHSLIIPSSSSVFILNIHSQQLESTNEGLKPSRPKTTQASNNTTTMCKFITYRARICNDIYRTIVATCPKSDASGYVCKVMTDVTKTGHRDYCNRCAPPQPQPQTNKEKVSRKSW